MDPMHSPLETIARQKKVDGLLVRVVKLEGFGGRRDGEVLYLHADGCVGGLFGELFTGRSGETFHPGMDSPAVTEVPIGDTQAVSAGLACGGTAQVVVQPIADIPELVWASVQTRNAVTLATELFGTFRTAAVTANSPTDLDPSLSALIEVANQHSSKGRTRTAIVETEVGSVFVETLQPVPHVLVIGASQLASSLVAQARLLGWTGEVVDERLEPTRCAPASANLGGVDALMVLSHDIAISSAAIASALTNNCGYVGALGSRHTQAARAEELRVVHGLSDEVLGRVYGPIGLNIGSRTPEETAIAVFAEVLANRSGRAAASLRGSSGPING
jgi:xanthine dehydrogenase accessory factor